MNKKTFLTFGLSFFIILLAIAQEGDKNEVIKQYIGKYKDIAIKEMYEFKVPASITLAQGILESGIGKSDLAVKANNHFGIKCHKEWRGKTYIMDDDEKDECFRKYDSPEESFRDHSYFLSTRERYAELFKLEITDYKGWAHGLKKAGYATNPGYAHILIRIIEANQLYNYDQQSDVPQTISVATEKHEISFRTKKSNTDDFEAISINGYNRKIYENNNIRFVRAKKDDSFRKIADDMEMLDWQLARYNDMSKDSRLKEDQIIYIQPKKKKGSKEYHIVKPHETMHFISQLHGIKLKQLYKKNNMNQETTPRVGQKLYLRKRLK